MSQLINQLIHWTSSRRLFGYLYFIGDHSVEGYRNGKKQTLEERTEREIGLILNFLKPIQSSSILDCPCGYGRHSIELAKKNFKVTGIDLSPLYLKMANEEAKRKNLSTNVKFVKMDMRKLNLSQGSFDYVINMFTSFGFFDKEDDNIAVIKNFSKVLKQSGKLLIHLDYNSARIKNGKYFNGDEHKSRKCFFNNVLYELFVEEDYDEKTKRLNGSWDLRNGKRKKIEYSLRIYDNNEICDLITTNGFNSVTLYDPEISHFSDESKETIIIATK